MSDLLAVIEPGAAWVLSPGRRPVWQQWARSASVWELLDDLAAWGIRQAWIHDSALAWLGLPSAPKLPHGWLYGDARAWDANVSRETTVLPWWIRCRRLGQSLAIAIPAYNTDQGVWGCWNAPAACDLAYELADFCTAIDMLPVAGPGRTAEALLRKVSIHSKYRGWTDLHMTELPPDSVWANAKHETDMVWMRPLPPDASRLVAYDRNSHYLGPMSSLNIGFGKLAHISQFRRDGVHHPPGYWRAHIHCPAPASRGLPDPFPHDNLSRWYTTPTMELASELGADIECDEAWVWFEHHRLLAPLYTRLRAAQREVEGNPRDAIKAMYTQFVGRLESQMWDRSNDSLFRPDIRAAIIAKARANFWRSMARVSEPPVLVYVDEAIYALDDYTAASEAEHLPVGTGLGEYKRTVYEVTDRVAAAWNGRGASPSRALAALKAKAVTA